MRMIASPAEEALRTAFEELLPSSRIASRAQRERLQGAVCALVDELKAAGMNAEHVVIRIRAIAREIGRGGFSDTLVADAVRWCIARYYEDVSASEDGDGRRSD